LLVQWALLTPVSLFHTISLPAAHIYRHFCHLDRYITHYHDTVLTKWTLVPMSLQGSLLSLFLGPDGGPHKGTIHLPPKKITDVIHLTTIPEEESLPPTLVDSLPCKTSLYNGLCKASRTFSGVFASHVPDPMSSPAISLTQSLSANCAFPCSSHADGYAYGYGSGSRALSFHLCLGSNMSGASYRQGSQSFLCHHLSNMTILAGEGTPQSFRVESELSFVQCLLMANENVVTNIVDLWVAAAMDVDNEEVFENNDTELEGPNESVFDLDGDDQSDNSPTGAEDTATERGKHIAGMSLPSMPSICCSSHVAPFHHLSSPQHQASQSPQQCHPSLQYGTSIVSNCSCGGLWVLMGTTTVNEGHRQQTTGTTMNKRDDNDNGPQPYKQLLVGWIVGANGL
jgi:hypothetical protein